jgi:cell division protein FtsI (penicillin-binding protein 3)
MKRPRRRVSFIPTDAERRTRAAILAGALIAALAALGARCVQLQVFRSADLIALARAQHEGAVTLDPRRGPIYDRSGEELALSIDVDSVYADPMEVGDAGAASRRLAPVLGMKASEVRDKLDADKQFVWLRRKIDPEMRRRVEALKLPGIHFTGESKRFYPKRALAAHILGACGVDNQGLAGIEYAYNDHFTGTPGRLEFIRDGRGGRVLYEKDVDPVPGDGLVLTLDATIQHIAEREIDVEMQESGAEGAAVVVLRPQTGEVLALASRPGFDPNVAGAIDNTRRNRVVTDFYEPGSTFKVITAATALDAGKVKPNEVIFCENGLYILNKRRIREDKLPFGDLTFTEVLAHSSNIGTVKVANRLSSTAFIESIQRFGFGTQSALELPGESPGLLRPLKRWTGFSQASIAIGQEVGVTPIQLAAAMGAIANDGVYNPPTILRAFVRPDGTRVSPERPADFGPHRAVSAQAARTLRQMLESVTTDGSGKAALVPGYSTAGKTGTAQKIDPETHRYAPGRYAAWFAGFVPAMEPALVIVVMVDEPKGLHRHGGDVSAPVFSRIAEPVLQYLQVPPDGDGALVIDAPLTAKNELPRRLAPPKAVPASRKGAKGAGAAGDQDANTVPAPANASMLGFVVPITTKAAPATAPGTMPDVTGLSLRQAIETLATLGLNCVTERTGPRVSRQVPPPGTPVSATTRCGLMCE